MRFGLVGVAATLVHLLVANMVLITCSSSVYLSSLCGFATAFLVSYLGHYYFTFQTKKAHQETLIRFFSIAFGGFLGSYIVLALLARLDLPSETIRLTISILIIPVITYLLAKGWAFKQAKD